MVEVFLKFIHVCIFKGWSDGWASEQMGPVFMKFVTAGAAVIVRGCSLVLNGVCC